MLALLKPRRRCAGVVGKRPDWRRRFDQVAVIGPPVVGACHVRLTRPPLTVWVRACGIPGSGSTPTYSVVSAPTSLVPHSLTADNRVRRRRWLPSRSPRRRCPRTAPSTRPGARAWFPPAKKPAGAWPEPFFQFKILRRPQQRRRVAAVHLARHSARRQRSNPPGRRAKPGGPARH